MNNLYKLTAVSVLLSNGAITAAFGQQGQPGFFNERLLAQKIPSQNYSAIWKSDELQCQAEAAATARQLVPRTQPCDPSWNPYAYFQCERNNEQVSQLYQSKGRDLYMGCLANRGWTYGVRPVAQNPPEISSPPPGPELTNRRATNVSPSLASTGTGIIVSAEGHILTSAHAVENCDALKVKLINGDELAANLVSVDAGNDLAILRSGLRSAVANFKRGPVVVGSRLVIYGYSISGAAPEIGNFTKGVVSGMAGNGGDPSSFQFIAPVQPGNSGVVMDEYGLVVGTYERTLELAKTQKALADSPQNVNIAIKSSVIQNFLDAQGIQYLEKPRQKLKSDPAIGLEAGKVTTLVMCYRL